MPHRRPLPRPPLMSWVNHTWDLFLRARARRLGSDLADFRCPSVPGWVSVVLPVFNGADYLCAAVDSILAQTYRDFELIIVNDGSTDDTPRIIEDYGRRDQRVRAIHQENRKLPAALNAGFALARGEFLTWTSADNIMRPDCLARLVADLRSRPGVDMIYADHDIIDERGRILTGAEWCAALQEPPGSGRVRLLHDTSILNLIDGNYIGPAFLYRDRAAALLGPYDPAKFSYEDYDFFMRVNAALTLRHAGFTDSIYEYRIHGDSLSAREKEFRRAEKTRELILFDAFRRELLTGPACWIIEADESPQAAALADFLKNKMEQAEHILLDARLSGSLPRLWVPCACVRITDNAASAETPAPAQLPACLKVLVYCGNEILNEQMHPGWDMCIAISDSLRLNNPHQGWFACMHPGTLWQAACIRLFSDHARAVEQAAFNLQSSASISEDSSLKTSVIICTRDRSGPLARALRSVCEQQIPSGEFELIVVNNNPMPDANHPASRIATLIESLRAEFFPSAPERIRLVACPLRGLSHARNAGLAEARGGIVAFLDDDAIARPGWLARIIEDFSAYPDLGVLGGPVLVQPPRPAPAWFSDSMLKYWSHFQPATGAFEFAADWTAFPIGANWSARRELLYRIGGFRTAFGRGGATCDAGEEIVAALQIRQLGVRVAVDPIPTVDHAVDSARFALPALWRSILDGWMLRLHLEQDRYMPRTMRIRDLAWHGVKRLGRSLFSRGLTRPERIEHALYAAAALRIAAALVRRQFQRLRKPLFK